jgi:hypothetical protein
VDYLVDHSNGPVHNVGAAEADGRWFHWDRRRMLCHLDSNAANGLPSIHGCHGNAKWQQVVNFSTAAEFFVALKGGNPLMMFDYVRVTDSAACACVLLMNAAADTAISFSTDFQSRFSLGIFSQTFP